MHFHISTFTRIHANPYTRNHTSTLLFTYTSASTRAPQCPTLREAYVSLSFHNSGLDPFLEDSDAVVAAIGYKEHGRSIRQLMSCDAGRYGEIATAHYANDNPGGDVEDLHSVVFRVGYV